MKFISLFLSLILSTQPALAAGPVIWNGQFSKSLAQSGFQHFSNRQIRDCGAVDPSAGAGIAASEGSLCQYDAGVTGTLYVKSAAADTGWTNVLTSSSGWSLSGNAGTTAGTNFLGTTDAQSLVLKANNTEWLRMLTTGEIGIGIAAPTAKLHQDSGNATATYHKFTAGTTTGVTSTDGFDVGIDTSGNAQVRQREALPLGFFTNNTEKMTILSDGKVGMGITVPTESLHVYGTSGGVTFLMEGDGTGSDLTNARYSGNTNAPANSFRKSRGTKAVPAVVQSGDGIGTIDFTGYDSAAYRTMARIQAFADATVSSGDAPGRLTFSTTLDGASSASERMRITNAGFVGIGTTVPGSRLSVTGSYSGAVTNLSADTTLDSTHQIVTVDDSAATRTITLPDCLAAIIGRTYRIKKMSASNSTVVARSSADLIDGATSVTITQQYGARDFVCTAAAVWSIY